MHEKTQAQEASGGEITQTQDILGSLDEFLNRHPLVVEVKQVTCNALVRGQGCCQISVAITMLFSRVSAYQYDTYLYLDLSYRLPGRRLGDQGT